jgi:hypothetical protein
MNLGQDLIQEISGNANVFSMVVLFCLCTHTLFKQFHSNFNYTEQSPSKADSRLSGQDISCLLAEAIDSGP